MEKKKPNKKTWYKPKINTMKFNMTLGGTPDARYSEDGTYS